MIAERTVGMAYPENEVFQVKVDCLANLVFVVTADQWVQEVQQVLKEFRACKVPRVIKDNVVLLVQWALEVLQVWMAVQANLARLDNLALVEHPDFQVHKVSKVTKAFLANQVQSVLWVPEEWKARLVVLELEARQANLVKPESLVDQERLVLSEDLALKVLMVSQAVTV